MQERSVEVTACLDVWLHLKFFLWLWFEWFSFPLPQTCFKLTYSVFVTPLMDQKGQEVLADMPANRGLPQSFYIFFFLFQGFSPCGCKLVALCAMLPILLLHSYMTCTSKWFRISAMKSQGILPSSFSGVWGFHFSFDISMVPFSQTLSRL